jgi:hypothetical protein
VIRWGVWWWPAWGAMGVTDRSGEHTYPAAFSFNITVTTYGILSSIYIQKRNRCLAWKTVADAPLVHCYAFVLSIILDGEPPVKVTSNFCAYLCVRARPSRATGFAMGVFDWRSIMDVQNLEEYLADLPNRVWGENEADRARHTQARVAFMNLMAQHLNQEGIFTAWTIHAGVYQAMLGMQAATLKTKELKQRASPSSEIRSAELHYQLAGKTIVSALRSGGTLRAANLAHYYVSKELGLDWYWLTMELAIVKGIATDTPEKQYRQYIPYEPPAPPFHYHFEPLPDETFAAMIERFRDDTTKQLKELTEQYKRLHPKGRIYSNQDVERYVEYFFRMQVRGEAARHIGHYDIEGKRLKKTHVRDRNDVKDQAAIARRWLSIGFTQRNLEEALLLEADKNFSPGEVDLGANSPTSEAPEKPV